MEGPDKFRRFVVIEFPTFDQAVACFTSPEYEEAAAFRRSGAGEVETIIVEGGDDGHDRSEEPTSELESLTNLVCRLLLGKNISTEHTTVRQGMSHTLRHT